MPSSSLSIPPAESFRSAMPPPAEGAELNLQDLLQVLKRHSWILVACVSVCTALALIHAITATSQYTATATIEVNGPAAPTLGLDDLANRESGSSTPEMLTTDLLTQQAQLTSPSTILAAIERLHLERTPTFAIPTTVRSGDPLYAERGLPLAAAPHQRDRILKLFAAHLEVAIVKGTRLLEITYTSPNPVEAARVTNALVGAYVDRSSQSRLQTSSEVSKGLADQLTTLKAKVIESQRAVEDYEKSTGLAGIAMLPAAQGKDNGGDASPSGNIPVSRLLAFNDELTRAELARIAKAAIYRMTQSMDPDAVLGIPGSPLAASLGPDGGVTADSMGLTQLQNLRQQLTQISIEMATAETRYGPRSDRMLELKHRDTAVRQQIAGELVSVRARAKRDLDLATLAETSLHQQVAQQEETVTAWGDKEDHLALLEGEATSSRELYQDLYTKFQEAQLASSIDSSTISVMTPALVPSQPSSPQRKRELVIGFSVGLILGIMLAFVVDYFDDSIHSPLEASKLAHLPLAMITPFPLDGGHYHGVRRLLHWPKPSGNFSLVPNPGQSCLVQDPHSEFSEAYRAARTVLLKTRNFGAVRSFVVASGVSGEGRAAACLNLAVAFALLGERVLLLDADMHGSPLSFSGEKGLSDCLLRGLPISEAIQKSTDSDHLYLLPAGDIPPNPAELSCSSRFAEILSAARSQFDYVFIHCPSVLMFSEASIIASLADGYLLVARSGKTRRADLSRTMELLRTPRTSLMGLLLNDSPSAAPFTAMSEQFMGARQRA